MSFSVPKTVVQKLEKLLKGREQERKREEKKDQVRQLHLSVFKNLGT